MSNKKRIQKKSKTLHDKSVHRDMWNCIGKAYLSILFAIERYRLLRIASQPSKNYPPGGFVSASNDDNEVILQKNGKTRDIEFVAERIKDIGNVMAEDMRKFSDTINNLPKQREGMMALERQKDGSVKTVFAGSRDARLH